MIGRVLKRGARVYGVLWYLYGPGKECVHSSPHLVSGWRHPADLEPPLRDNGKPDFRRLTGLLEQPLALLGEHAPAKPVWHCTVRAAPGDPDLGDGAWMRIAGEVMDRSGLSRYGEEHQGVRWVAVHQGENHIHIVAVLARQDGRRARLDNDFYRIGEACRDIEKEYGLQVVARADRTAADRPTRAEQEKAARAGRPEPPRVTLQRQVAAAAAGARSRAGILGRPGQARPPGPAAAQPDPASPGDRVRGGPARRRPPVARARRAGAPAAQRGRQRAAAAQRARDDLPVVPCSAAP